MSTATRANISCNIGDAKQAFLARFGPERFRDNPETIRYLSRTTMPDAPTPAGIVKVACREDLIACMKIAGQYKTPVYPVSGGKNWGLGSSCPTTDGQIILDLSGMNRIVEVNPSLGYAVIEPGVTQGQLHRYLADNQIDLWMDATGAGPDATVIGNLMERGYGHSPNGDRFHNSCAFEIILSDGSILKTGWAHDERSVVSDLFKTGIGPSIDGLFTQSNLGVVAQATVWLIPRPACFSAYAFRLRNESELSAAIDALRPLRALGVINSVVHLANDYRIISAHRRFPYSELSGEDSLPTKEREQFRDDLGLGQWNVLGGIYGTKESVSGVKRAISKSLRKITRPIFIDDKKLAFFDFVYDAAPWIPGLKKLKSQVESGRSAVSLLKGQPVRDHLAGSGWRSKLSWEEKPTDPLDRGDGMIWITPLIPLTGTAATDFLEKIQPVYDRHGFEPLLTFVMISERIMCCPTTIAYNRDCEIETVRAKACYEEILATVLEHGYMPYRAGIKTMSRVVDEKDTYWQTIRKIKKGLDPDGIIAPGRYGLQ